MTVKVHYQHRDGGTALVNYEKDIKRYREACEIIEQYPWAKEVQLSAELEEGGGLQFILGDSDAKYACYQLIPAEENKGLLSLDIICKRGFLGIFGRQARFVDFDVVSISEAKQRIQDLFNHSVDTLYEKYKK